MQYSSNSFQGKGVLEVARFGSSISGPLDAAKFKRFGSNEPISVLDKRSPSPSTSTSASSSSFGGTNTNPTTAVKEAPATAGAGLKEEWMVGELQPLPFGLELDGGGSEKYLLGFEDFESFLYESGGSDQSLFPWVSGEFEDPSLSSNEIHGNVGFAGSDNFLTNVSPPVFPSFSGLSFKEHQADLKPQISNFYGIQEELPPPAKRPNLEILNSTPASLPYGGFAQIQPSSLLHPPPPKQEVGQQAVYEYDQIYKAAELIQAGQFSHAQMILARLNHQLSPIGKPLQRAASYFKEALMLPLQSWISLPQKVPSPVDFVFKMTAYTAFSEASPVLQFMNFTSNQALLEAVGEADYVHVFDFDIGFGAQWSSFMQELPKRNGRAPSLKITAFASPSTHHPVEINLMHESLSQFAIDVGVTFELEVVNLDTFDPSSYASSSFYQFEGEVIVVNFPVWSLSNHLPKLPVLLHYIKRLSPRIIVSFDRGCDRAELPFPHQILEALKYYEALLESISAAKVTSDAGNKMERFIFQPSIEGIVQGRLRFPEDQMPPWRGLFASAGFLPVAFSGFTEAQAECVVKRSQFRGFHVEKRQTSLVLCWQRKELLTAVAWRC